MKKEHIFKVLPVYLPAAMIAGYLLVDAGVGAGIVAMLNMGVLGALLMGVMKDQGEEGGNEE